MLTFGCNYLRSNHLIAFYVSNLCSDAVVVRIPKYHFFKCMNLVLISKPQSIHRFSLSGRKSSCSFRSLLT